MSNYVLVLNDELYHHGIKGQKWGIRRFQNRDGSLTPRGKKRIESEEGSEKKSSIDKKKLAKGIAIGVGAAAAVGVAAYLGSKYVKSNAARIAAESGMQEYRNLIQNGTLKLRSGISENEAAMNRGKAIYEQVSKGISTKNAVKTNLEYLNTGKSLKSLTSANDLGRRKSTAELAVGAAKAQISNRIDNYKTARSIPTKSSSGILKKGGEALKKGASSLKKPRIDVSKMSDADLAEKVKRLNMESRYKQLTRRDNALEKFNKKVAPVAAATGTALTLYSNADRIKSIIDKESKKKKPKN